jgi:hypothetical protein
VSLDSKKYRITAHLLTATNNIYELTLRATDSSETVELSITVEIYVPIAPPEKKDEGDEVLVNGKSETAGELTVEKKDDGKTYGHCSFGFTKTPGEDRYRGKGM